MWKSLKSSKAAGWLKKHAALILFLVTGLTMDAGVRAFGQGIAHVAYVTVQPFLFTLCWLGLFLVIFRSVSGWLRTVLYWLWFAVFFIMALANAVYFGLTGIYFSFHILDMADEGSSYILDTVKNANPLIFIWGAALITLGAVSFHFLKREKRYSLKQFGLGVLVFLIIHTLLPLTFGLQSDELKWNSFKKARSIYESFTDYNRSMKISGFYEYTLRNFYLCRLKPAEQASDETEAFLNSAYEEGAVPEGGTGLGEIAEKYLGENVLSDGSDYSAYRGIFEGKNVIFLQLEGMDSWLLTEETTPNLYALKEQSVDFTDHYSLYSGGGSTFNSEFAVNTGFVTPASYTVNAYTLHTNTYEYTLPQLFREQGYSANAFHMNNESFYSRGINYRAWGYENFYGLLDVTEETEENAELDRTLITNETFRELMFNGEQPFLDYIITYSPHTPFTTEKGVGKTLASEAGITEELGEEETAKLMASETDRMVGLLIEALKEYGLYENTVIVCFADHYLYTLEDSSILENNKDTTGNLINHTPFFIWSADVTPVKVERVTMQMNILPTVLGLFGIDYEPEKLLFGDALSEGYTGIACFSDYSWYDGRTYVEDGEVVAGEEVSGEYIAAVEAYVKELYRKNDWTLRYDYFAEKKQKK